MRVAVCLTGQWRAGSDLDGCRQVFLRTCFPEADFLTTFRIDSIRDASRPFSATQQQLEQVRRCAQQIRSFERNTSAPAFDHVLRIRPDTIPYAIPLPRIRSHDIWTYRPFWTQPGANARVQLNDVFMWFGRKTFDRFFLSDQLSPRPSSPHTACNFTGSRKDRETFECWLHDRARGLNVTWRSLRNPSSWVLHRRTSRDRRARLARVRCKCT